MVQEILIEQIGRVLKNKIRLEKELQVQITHKGKLVFVEGDAEKEYLALKVLEAIDLGFEIDKSLLLKNEEIILQVLNIKDITKRNDLERVRARIIGTHGKTIENMERLSNCEICLHDNDIGIIGDCEIIKEAIISLKSLVQGSKQSNVYARLEKKKKERRLKPVENIKNEFKHRKRK